MTFELKISSMQQAFCGFVSAMPDEANIKGGSKCILLGNSCSLRLQYVLFLLVHVPLFVNLVFSQAQFLEWDFRSDRYFYLTFAS